MVYISRVRWALLGMVAVLCIISLAFSLHGIIADVPTMADFTALPVIVIDAGHGGVDGGAVGADGTVEKDINLHICLILRDMFLANGFDVVMTRETDVSIHDDGITSTKKQKTSDLHNRLKMVNNTPGCIFLSIHQNKFGDKRSSGAQVFYSPNHPESERLAATMQAAFVRNLQPENTRLHKKAGKNLFLMYESQCPSVLIECGFLSNENELIQLKDTEHQSKIAFTAFCAVMEFLELNAADMN